MNFDDIVRKNNNDWFKKQSTTKKGDFAEEIVKNNLEEKGYKVYITKSKGSHLCDEFITNTKEKNIFQGDSKAKARRNKMPDTGIDLYLHKRYEDISKKHNMRFFLYFIDEELGLIYGNFLDILDKKRTIKYNCVGSPIIYPHNERTKQGKIIRYFPLISMKIIGKLSSEQTEILKKYSRRLYLFDPNKNEKITIEKSEIKEEIGKVFRKNNCELLF